MARVKVKNTINLELREGDEFELTGKSAKNYIQRLSNFSHYVQVEEGLERGVKESEAEALTVRAADNFAEMTVIQLKAELTEKGITFDSHAKKTELIELLSKVGE